MESVSQQDLKDRPLQQLWMERLDILEQLQAKLDYRFTDTSLLMEALTHSSAAKDFNASQSTEAEGAATWYERLEFLGDAVLGLAVSAKLMQIHQQFDEGQLSKLRAALIRESQLAAIGNELGLGAYILLGRSEHRTGGRKKQSILADVVESVIGAVYMDGGLTKAQNLVLRLYADYLQPQTMDKLEADTKSLLQEFAQKHYKVTPTYKVLASEGPAHDPEFKMGVFVGEKKVGEASASSKKRASMLAAKAALETLKKD